MKLTLIILGVVLLVTFDIGNGRPLDDENNGKLCNHLLVEFLGHDSKLGNDSVLRYFTM